ncbi:Plastocyanin-like protein [Corchorus capsularis]|uniref:Plastocyanin-like protein n=1 Tax=Corchorus capsularis TaxID=210143 RepID=A0A1R3IEX4_COCAP|nr:Plastocyanin-like protein [Corchorus capsularis]
MDYGASRLDEKFLQVKHEESLMRLLRFTSNGRVGEDDVAEVTETAYDYCTTNDRIHHYKESPVSITLKDPKDYYFLCTFSNHCAGGQKLHVQVLNSTANTDILGSASSLVPTLYLVLFISIVLLLLF